MCLDQRTVIYQVYRVISACIFLYLWRLCLDVSMKLNQCSLPSSYDLSCVLHVMWPSSLPSSPSHVCDSCWWRSSVELLGDALSFLHVLSFVHLVYDSELNVTCHHTAERCLLLLYLLILTLRCSSHSPKETSDSSTLSLSVFVCGFIELIYNSSAV